MPNNSIEINRFKVTDAGAQLQPDPIAIEEPLQISLIQNQTQQIYSLTMRTPGNDKELVYGLLFSEGVIDNAGQVESLELSQVEGVDQPNLVKLRISETVDLDLDDNRRRHASYSGCGLCGKTSLQALELKQARPLKPISGHLDTGTVKALKALLAKQPLFSMTGGVHAAGLIYQQEGVLQPLDSPFFEDVGRHNALDKLIGHELLQNDLQQTGILVLSGRIGFELVQKAVMAGFSVIIALGAPSNLAIQAANRFNLALIGFAKESSFNLYTSHQNLLDKTD